MGGWGSGRGRPGRRLRAAGRRPARDGIYSAKFPNAGTGRSVARPARVDLASTPPRPRPAAVRAGRASPEAPG